LLPRPHPVNQLSSPKVSVTSENQPLFATPSTSDNNSNAEVATALLEDLAGRGLDAFARRLLVIDGAKALRKAINRGL
jgi:hypothetical protein